MTKGLSNKSKMDYAYVQLTKFLKTEFNMRVTIPYTENSRLSKTHARINLQRENGSTDRNIEQLKDLKIEYGTNFLTHSTPEQVVSVAKREALHLALYLQGHPYEEGTPEFESILLKHGLPLSNEYSQIIK